MPDLKQLQGLERRLVEAEGADRGLDLAVGLGLGGWYYEHRPPHGKLVWVPEEKTFFPDAPGAMYPHLTEGLDAAIALVERTLPGTFWLVGHGKCSAGEPPYGAQLLFGTDEVLGEGESSTAALALLLALVRALIAKEETAASQEQSE